MKSLQMFEPYTFGETVLLKGATYKIGAILGGRELTMSTALELVQDGFAKGVE